MSGYKLLLLLRILSEHLCNFGKSEVILTLNVCELSAYLVKVFFNKVWTILHCCEILFWPWVWLYVRLSVSDMWRMETKAKSARVSDWPQREDNCGLEMTFVCELGAAQVIEEFWFCTYQVSLIYNSTGLAFPSGSHVNTSNMFLLVPDISSRGRRQMTVLSSEGWYCCRLWLS